MALVNIKPGAVGVPTFTVGEGGLGDNLYVFGDASDAFVGTVNIQIVERSAGTCSFTVKSRSRVAGVSLPDGTAAGECPFVGQAYLQISLGTTATAGATYATAAIADQGAMIEVPATGRIIALDVDYTDGIWDVYVFKVEGASC